MNLKGICYAKWNVFDREIQILYDLTLYLESKRNKFVETRSDFFISKGWGWGVKELGEGDEKIQTSSYKINNYWRYNVQHDHYS